jgi:hypothetical protein
MLFYIDSDNDGSAYVTTPRAIVLRCLGSVSQINLLVGLLNTCQYMICLAEMDGV